MRIFAAILTVVSLAAGRVAAEKNFSSDADFLAACSDAAHDVAEYQRTHAGQKPEKITGTMPDPYKLAPELEVCDKAMRSVLGNSYYAGPDLMLLTDKAAYYQSEGCDICASLDRCDLKTHEITSVKDAHYIECKDLDPVRAKEKVLFDSCKK